MKKLFTLEQQTEEFALGKEAFLNGHYEEAEMRLRLVIESSFQNNDYHTYVSALIWLNRTFINTAQIQEVYTSILILESLITQYGTQEEYFFFRLQQTIFNNFYAIGDTMSQFEQLFKEILRTGDEPTILFLVGSNLLYTYCEKDEIDKGIELYEQLTELLERYDCPNKMTRFMHNIYAFLLFYAKRDWHKCADIMHEIDTNDEITVVDSFAYLYNICLALLKIQTGEVEEAKLLFDETIQVVGDPAHIRHELKLWIEALKELRLYEEVMTYQQIVIDILETQYASEIGQVRKQSMREMSRQFYEGQLFVDQLTNVKNRNFYENLLAKQQRVKNYTVVVLDIDRFKSINDTYGHIVGDQAIKFIAGHLSKWTPRHDISVVRYGGDEFILLIPYHYDDVRQSIDALHKTILTTPFYIPKVDETIYLSVSMGVGYTEHRYQSIESLFEVADTAIYEAKKKRSTIVAASS